MANEQLVKLSDDFFQHSLDSSPTSAIMRGHKSYFDKIEELVFVESENGQRGVASFKAYKFENSELQPDRYGITSIEPFRSLDEMSKVDYLTKRITIYNSGGNCANSYEIYKLQPAKNEFEGNSFILEKRIEEQRDEKSNKCYELTYSVIGQSKKLLSKKEIN